MTKQVYISCCWCLLLLNGLWAQGDLVLQKTIGGDIRPKSIVHNGQGLFFAQNMMYRHTITVYDRQMRLIKTLSDRVRFADYNLTGFIGEHQGSPVEATFSNNGEFAWVSNYKMYGKGFDNPGGDQCDPEDFHDQSFVYKINTDKLSIDHVVEVGAVPKFLMATPDGEKILVSNWCSGDLSIIDTELGIETSDRVPLGDYPRGIAVDSKSRYAYVTVMGEEKIGIIKLSNLAVSWLEDVGKTPRHILIGPADRYLYVSLSRPGKVVKIDLVKRGIIAEAEVGKEARSMVMTPDGTHLYVTNYKDNSLSKVRTEDMRVLETVKTGEMPIGVTFDAETGRLWVACYSGSIMVFEDKAYQQPLQYADLIESGESIGPLPPADEEAMAMTYVPGSNNDRSNPEDDPYYFIYRDQEADQPKETDAAPSTDSSPRNVESRSGTSVRPTPPPAPAAKTTSVRHYVIVGSFKTRSQAQNKLSELLDKGYGAKILNRDDGGFRVSAHDFASKSEASATVNSLKRYKISAWILTQ